MIYGYARVSTETQGRYGNSLGEQIAILKENGAQVIYTDVFTGKTNDRPEFQKMLEALQSGDTVMATKLDRISRSAARGIALADELLERGINLHILNMGKIDGTTSTGKLLRNILFAFAEFERDMIRERTAEGKAVAREKGTLVEGRPKKNTEAVVVYLSKARAGEMTVEECCKELGISKRTWYNRISEIA